MRSLLVVIVISVALFATGCAPGAVDGPAEPIETTLLVSHVVPAIADSLAVGDTVRIMESGTVIGAIADVTAEDARVAVPDEDGVLREARSPLYFDVTITVEGEAVVDDDGVRFGRETVYVNSETMYLTPLVQFDGVIIGMQTLGEAQ